MHVVLYNLHGKGLIITDGYILMFQNFKGNVLGATCSIAACMHLPTIFNLMKSEIFPPKAIICFFSHWCSQLLSGWKQFL